MEEKTARGDTTGEKFSLSKPNDQGAEDVLHLLVGQALGDNGQGLDSLLTDDSFVLLSKLLEKRQKESLIRLKLPI